LLVLAGCRAAPREPAAEERHLVTPSELCVTTGQLRAGRPFVVDTGELRASVAGETPAAAELTFRYDGPSRDTVPLSSGELRRQVGLKLRGQDACNVVYVMWHLEPTHGVFVSVKRNRAMQTYEECGAGGYLGVEPLRASATPSVAVGDTHVLRAELTGATLRVAADGAAVWEGSLPLDAFAFDGPVGIRTDNVAVRFDLRVDDASRVTTCRR